MPYIGVRIEVTSRIANQNFKTATQIQKRYNKIHKATCILDPHDNGRITVEKTNAMIIARGKQDDRGDNGLVNFSVMGETSGGAEAAERVVKIINVLGNDRLVRERVKTFVDGKSMLNSLPELEHLIDAFNDLEVLMPGFIRGAWYYAPEAKLE
jgi:hypothetical protein